MLESNPVQFVNSSRFAISNNNIYKNVHISQQILALLILIFKHKFDIKILPCSESTDAQLHDRTYYCHTFVTYG